MDLIQEFRKRGYYTSSLYHLLTEKKSMPPETEIIPSRYIKEMKMSAQERLRHLEGVDICNLASNSDPNLKAVVEFSPRLLVFQNYKPNDKMVAKFTIRNISRGPVFINSVFKQSSNFFLKPVALLSRLAPGIHLTYVITFIPHRAEDYIHRVTFVTDKQQYVVPLIGMGPRPIFDFPDEIFIPPTPLKVENYVVLYVKNISCIKASCTMVSKCPFGAKPSFCHNMLPDEYVEVKVIFKSMHLGESRGKLVVTCDTDEVFVIKLTGTTYTVSIELEKAVVRFLDTYNTMQRQQAFKITNKSNQVITYMCMKNSNIFNDFEDKIKLATIFYDVKDSESAKYQKLVHYEVLSSDEHERVYTRIFFDEIHSLVADESLHFNDLNFSIMPIKGNLWPNETTSISITFTPKEIGDFVAVAYLDIDGIMDRIPLTMQGTSLPPKIHLHLENLDMDNVYINKTYRYEIVAINNGHINGVIEYKEVAPLFGSVISCIPDKHCLRPGEKEVFVVSFLNSNQGPYFEELNFVIRDTDLVRKLYLKGTVIYPTMTFSIPCLDFGKVNVGVPKSLQVDVINESEVNVVAIPKISSDGPEISSITLEDCEACENTELISTPQWPKEFNIEPTKIIMTANTRMTLRVTITANLVRANQTVLELELEKSDSPPITLPILFDARVPEIIPAPEIKLRACFVDFTYSYDVVISSNEYWGYFIIDKPKEENTLKVNVTIQRGIIRPNSTITFPVTIVTAVLGPQEYVIRMRLIGLTRLIDVCNISVLGIRPIVTCHPISLHWGHLKLLTRINKNLTLANDSPVTVYFKAGILYNDGRWSIQPEEGYIEPEGVTDVTLSLCLIDADTYTNKAVIHLEKVKDILVPLAAVGVGTSIVVGKDRDYVNLGRHFTKLPLEVRVPLENCGTRLHSLEWSNQYKSPKNKEQPEAFFSIEPRFLKIGAGEKTELLITGLSSKAGFIKEMWYLVGSVEGVNKKELLMECQITGEFVDPKIILTPTEIALQHDYGPYSEYYKLTDIITIKNVSKLPLCLDMSIKPPFAIVHRTSYKIPAEDEDFCCCIDKEDVNFQNSKTTEGQEVPKFSDCITGYPIQRKREGSLLFFQDIHKIKSAFEFTHVVEEWLEDEEVMKLQIVLDTTKHLTLKSKIYCDVMRVKFRGHNNKDVIRLTGKINFPNVVVYTPRVDFQCVLNGSIQSKTIKIHNPTDLVVCYKFLWKKWSATEVIVPMLPVVEYTEKFSETKTTTDEVQISMEPYDTADLLKPEELALDQEKNMIEGGDSFLVPESISTVTDTLMEFQIMKTKVLSKIAPMLFGHMEKESEFQWIHKFNKKVKQHSRVEIKELFQLMPHCGLLQPGDIHHIHVIFRPVMNIKVRATLELEVLGGPSEFIWVAGQSSDLIYNLNTRKLNFKIRSFHENASENLIITNLAQFVFEYKTYLNEPIFENKLPATICEIIPSEKEVGAEEEIEVAVVMRPGVLGFFQRRFLLEIGHLPHIPIEIFGWGVIPQLYFALPRPGLAKINVEIGYKAISAISLEYLEAVNEILIPVATEHLNSPQIEKCFEDPDFQDEWHICSAWDGFPTVMDVEMAIERYLVIRHIKAHPEIVTMFETCTKLIPIPGFHTMPYVIDFGVVITGNSVTSEIDVTNYGPIPVKIHFKKGFQNRYWLNVKLCGKLNPGETGKIEVTLSPDREFFPQYEQEVDVTINLEVPFGVLIPLNIKALCAVPFLKSNIDILDFGSVRCGDKIIASIPIANIGKPICVWYVSLRLKSPGPNPMTILDNSGKFEPGQSGLLNISFKPTMELLYEGTLIFRFHMNPSKMEIPVIGQGIFPHPHIIGPNLVFPPTLPWAETTELYFGITNPCPFPIELIIAHVDEKWNQEEELFQLLYRYYNKPEEMLVPALQPGIGMPKEVNEFYENFKKNVQRALDEELVAAAKQASSKAATSLKKAKSPKGKGKEQKEKVDKEAPPLRKIRNEAEIISDEIKQMKEECLDPLKECMMSIEDPPVEVDKYAKGLLLFLHGSPCEEEYCKEMAYTLGMQLGIPTVNFDSCFVQALCESNSTAKTAIIGVLNDNVENLRKLEKASNSNETTREDPYTFGEHMDEFEIVMKKFELYLLNKNIATPRSKTSDRKKKDLSAVASALIVGNASTIFQMEIVEELMAEYFAHEKFQCGFVMDSLTSIVVKLPSMVLTMILKCKSTIHNIHLVLCHSDFNKWAQAYDDALHEAELEEEQLNQIVVYTEEEIDKIVNDFEEMDAEEYENADPTLKEIYIKYGLEERRRRYYERMQKPDAATARRDQKTKEQATLEQVASDHKKNKIKKDDTKTAKFGPEYFITQAKYVDYQKNTYDSLIQIATNWIVDECDLAYPLHTINGAIAGVAQKKAKKNRSEIHVLQDSEVTEIKEDFVRGFPFTIIMCPCLIYKDALVQMFKNPEIEHQLKREESFNALELPVKRREYSVLMSKVMPQLRHEDPLNWLFLDEPLIKKCECNQMTDLNLLDDTTQDNVLNILAKWHCVCGKKMTSSQTSTTGLAMYEHDISASAIREAQEESPYFYPMPVRSVKSINAPTGRFVLEPGHLLRCKYAFNPTVEGNFTIKRFVEVAGWPESRTDINVTGICDLPRLDNRPKKMFANFVRRTVEDQVYKLTYLDDLKKFEFGPIFVGKERIYEEEYKIELRNASLLTTDVDIEFMDWNDVFQIDKSFISLEPGCRGQLSVTAAPTFIGDHEKFLLFCIKDNPEVVKINISCSGVVPIVEILPPTKVIDYGKILLYRREDERFIVRNDSILPIMWKIDNPEDFVEDFILPRNNGIVPRNENHVIPITYIACNVGIITQKPMIINIYDELGRGDPLLVDMLWYSAECYDVMLECAYENPNESFLNYGNVKVNSTVYRDLYFLNRGKYNLYYKLKKVKNFPEPSLLKSFESLPEIGMIPPLSKLVVVEFSCTPTTSMNLNNVPAYTCSLLDGSKDQVVVAKFPIAVTIASFYNTFTLFPLGELNFHILAVGSGVMREVILTNTSKCPFNYEIVVPEKYKEPEAAVAVTKVKDSKLMKNLIKCGNFIITNEDNLLAPGDAKHIPIQFLATAAQTFEETIHFIVTDTCPSEAPGVPLKLVGTGAMPVLDFWNLENTFREHLIVKSMNDYKVAESAPHCVLVEDSVTLHFFCVTVNTSHSIKIDLYNNGVVPCILKAKMVYQQNTNDDIFSLEKHDLQIDPLMHRRLGITFSPKALLEYRAILEIKLKLLQNEEETFQLCLIGEGVIPRIRLIKPPIRQHQLALLTFPVTCLESTTHKNLRFKNISTVNSTVKLKILQAPAERPVFWMMLSEKCKAMKAGDANEDNEYLKLKLTLKPNEIAVIEIIFSPLVKGRTNCDIKIRIMNNPYEYFTVMCEAEAFVEDVILMGLEMLSMDYDIDLMKGGSGNASTDTGGRKKSKSAPTDKQKTKDIKTKIAVGPNGEMLEPAVLKYFLDFGGCELCSVQKRQVIMMNNSEKMYKFLWDQLDYMIIKPTVGYISPGEEKDIEILFYSAIPVSVKREILMCKLIAISDEFLTFDSKGATWDNRQIQTFFDFNPVTGQNERVEDFIEDPRTGVGDVLGFINILIIHSVTTEYTKYLSNLLEETQLRDTYIYQKRDFTFKVENIGMVPMRLSWDFFIEDDYPGRIDRQKQVSAAPEPDAAMADQVMDKINTDQVEEKIIAPPNKEGGSKETLFSGSIDRYSVDTWFEMDIPFTITPKKVCLNPQECQKFTVTFSPLDAFDFIVRLRSTIDNLDPYDQNLSCKIMARSLIPYVHLDIEESDYLTSGKRVDVTGMVLPPHMKVMEFNVLGSGCYRKIIQVINPTSEAYEFVIEQILPDKKGRLTSKDFIPMHCDLLKGYVEGGTSASVTFTFAPTAPGVYESQWKFIIEAHKLQIPLMVVGIVRVSDVVFIPTILIIKSSLVGFTTTSEVILKNNENEALPFEFKGNSLVNESGKTVVVVRPNKGTLKPYSETKIIIYYTPVQDGPISFKIFCSVTHVPKHLTLCVNALSLQVKPTVTYYIIGYEHMLDYDKVTNIHLEQTASTYERIIPFKIKNDGSTTFTYDWKYVVAPVKKYLTVSVEPRTGYIAPAAEVECKLHFHLKTVPVQAYPVTLTISDGPLYKIYLHADIEKPLYHFLFKEYDFGKCIVNAPHNTYKKNLAFTNDDEVPVTLDLTTESTSELYVDYSVDPTWPPKLRAKIPIYFRPNAVQQYEFKLQFCVNSLCEETIIIRGEGVPLLVGLYEGCQKSFNLGPVKLGQKIEREIEVINHSKIPIECKFIFREVYTTIHEQNTHEEDIESLGTSNCLETNTHGKETGPSRTKCIKRYNDEVQQNQIAKDIKNALCSVSVVPKKATIQPHRKIPLKILFKPVGFISDLNVQLNVVAFAMERQLVLLSGSATGMSLCFSQNSLQFGRVRKRGCKILKVMLYNKGDLGTTFLWEPLRSEEFTISPMQGQIAAKTNVTFTITFRPLNLNPFIKVWAICHLKNYTNLELALYATCVDIGNPQNQSLYLECPAREIKTEYVTVTNPTDENWLVLSEFSVETSSFETLREFIIEANTTFDIPVHFKPISVGTHEAQVLFSPLGESALFISLIGTALHPNPNGVIKITVEATKSITQDLTVYNLTGEPELYAVTTELVKAVPERFEGYYEMKHPETVRVWGEAKATCLWSLICFEPCELVLKVLFINEVTRNYQFYEITATVTPSEVVGTLRFICCARESVQQELTVVNPLQEDSNFTVVSHILNFSENFTIGTRSKINVKLTYSPLVVGEFEDILKIDNIMTGAIIYRVEAICKPAKEKHLDFTTSFGTMIPMRLRVRNKSNSHATFFASTNHPSIIVERSYELQAHHKGKFPIWFEPTEFGVQNARVVFNSDVAGEYAFNIRGVAAEPKPQGPYNIKPGGFTVVTFKNVFEETRTFRFFVDREDFYLKTQMEQVKPKKEVKVLVYLTDTTSQGWTYPPTGCLTIENFEPVDPRVQWTYFLQGIP